MRINLNRGPDRLWKVVERAVLGGLFIVGGLEFAAILTGRAARRALDAARGYVIGRP